MKHSKIISLVLSLVLLATFFSGCSDSASSTQPTATAVTVTDMMGREIIFDAPATKIVALSPSDCEILCALGMESALVGRGEYCDFPSEITSVPSVQTGAETNLEQIIALAPQVVLMATMAQTKEQVSALEKAGIKVVVSDAKDIDGVYAAIELIGSITGKSTEAETVVSGMKKTFSDVSAKATGDGSKTVYFEVSPLEYGLWTAGSGTFMDELATMLGLKNAFSDINGWAEISEEQVIERDPDYIVTIAMESIDGMSPEQEIAGRDGWQGLKAVHNNAIFNVDSNEISRPGPRLSEAAETLYTFVYETMADKQTA